ncbi:MAG: hypothetical protein K8H99_07580, partial [Nitrospirae bacterium]|nr:hypothetical protein [Fimbriimonadaceae bacterium]
MTPTRAEFMHFQPWEKVLSYVLVFAAVGYMGWQIWQRAKLWRKGKPLDWKPDPVGNVLRYVLGQRKVQGARPRSGAPMHLLIFYGFLTLLIGTSLLAVNTYSEMLFGFKFHQGGYYLAYEMALDVMGVAFVVGVMWAMGRRLLARPPSVGHQTADLLALGLLLVLGVTGFWLEAARMANSPQPWDWSAPVGHWM